MEFEELLKIIAVNSLLEEMNIGVDVYTSIPCDELKEIILAADGKVTRHLEEATICIGNEKEDELIPCVSVQFVIEGVMNGKPPKVEDYCINDKTVLVEKDHSDSEEYSIVCFIDNKQDRFKN